MMSMNDPFGSMQGFINGFQQFAQNPINYLMQRNINIPQDIQNNPQQIQQYLLNSGRINQSQMNWAQNMARQIQQNPMFKQTFGNK